MTDSIEMPVPGVVALEHTADVGMEVTGATLPELFERGALGAMWMVLERQPAGQPRQPRSLDLVDPDLSGLFRAWLRTLLFWEETEGFVVRAATLSFFPAPLCATRDGQAFGLHGRVEGVEDVGPRVREIKGVTLHGLVVEQVAEGWSGRVIFDV